MRELLLSMALCILGPLGPIVALWALSRTSQDRPGPSLVSDGSCDGGSGSGGGGSIADGGGGVGCGVVVVCCCCRWWWGGGGGGVLLLAFVLVFCESVVMCVVWWC